MIATENWPGLKGSDQRNLLVNWCCHPIEHAAVEHGAPASASFPQAGLSEAARLEALSIAAEARTAGIMDLGLTRNGRIVTGTGTDCIVVASPCGGPDAPFAGLHTDIGVSLGLAIYDAVTAGGIR